MKAERQEQVGQGTWLPPQPWPRGKQLMPTLIWVRRLFRRVTLWPSLPGMVPVLIISGTLFTGKSTPA